MASSPARAEHAQRRRVVVGVSGSEASFATLAAAADEARLRDAPPHERLRGLAPRMLQQAAQGAELLVIGHTNPTDVLGPTAGADSAFGVPGACRRASEVIRMRSPLVRTYRTKGRLFPTGD